jgi:hypothetical protein
LAAWKSSKTLGKGLLAVLVGGVRVGGKGEDRGLIHPRFSIRERDACQKPQG